MMKENKTYKTTYKTIIDGELSESNRWHPDKGTFEGDSIVDQFIDEFKDEAEELEKFNDQIREIKIFEKKYIIYFALFGLGGPGKEGKLKISIPFESEEFREKIKDEKINEDVYVVYLYRPLKKSGEVEEEKRVWFIINPFEIFSSDGYKNMSTKKDHSPSSRWYNVKDVLEVINDNTTEVHVNNKENVFALSKNSILNFWRDPKKQINNLVTHNIKEHARSFLDTSVKRANKNKEKEREYNLSKLRAEFRSRLLMQDIRNNQINSKVKHKSLLVASHIHSVKNIESSKKTVNEKIEEIMDVDNGLLIPAGLDKLFDKYLITFDNEWNILCSQDIDPIVVEEMTNIKISIDNEKNGPWIFGKTEKSLKYLEKHRTEAFKSREYDAEIKEKFQNN